MKSLSQIFKKHPIAIIVFLLYAYFAQAVITGKWRYSKALSHINSGEKLAWGEGVMYGAMFLFFIATVYATVIIISSLFYKDEKRFYLWLLLAIATPVGILFMV